MNSLRKLNRFRAALAGLAALFSLSYSQAGAIPEGGKEMLSNDWSAQAKFSQSKAKAKGAAVDFGNGRTGWRMEVLDANATPTQIQLNVPITGEIRAQERILVAFDLRCVPEASQDGVGEGRLVVEIKDPPNYDKLGQDVVKCDGSWREITIPLPADTASVAGKTYFVLMLGGRKQTLELANLRVLNFGPDFPMEKLPRPYIQYPGREADAPWRKEALARIEKIRTQELVIEVVDAKGQPIPQAALQLEMKRHSFAFGTAVKAKYLQGDQPQKEKYQQMVDENFSAIVLENDLKPFGRTAGKSNTGKDYRNEWSHQSMLWAKERKMRVRGHYLCWGPWEKWSEDLRAEPDKIRERIMAHVDDVLAAGNGLVDEWDAINHPVGWESPRKTVDQVISPTFYADVVKAARARTSLPLFVNEDQVFRPGRQQEEFYTWIQEMIRQGARPDGIGNQAHFHSSHLPGAEELLRISDRFAALVPNLELTEFDVLTNGDEQLQADYLRDCLIMAYSHPAYTGFILWVFWEGAGWKPGAALWRTDWSEKPNAKVWRELVRGLWLTKANGQTDATGKFSARGHRGWYEISVTIQGKTTKQWFNTEAGTNVFRYVQAE